MGTRKVLPQLTLSERIAQYLAWETVKKMGWGSIPELWRMQMVLEDVSFNTAKYSISFKHDWGNYQVVIFLVGFQGKYRNADIYLIHPSVQNEYFSYSATINPSNIGGVENWDQVIVTLGERSTGELTTMVKALLTIE